MTKLLALALVIVPAIAAADPAKPADVMHTDDCAKATRAHKACALDITGMDVEGNRPVTGETQLTFRKFSEMSSLIRIRRDFIVEILKSAEDL